MHKNIKKIIVLAVLCTTFSTLMPSAIGIVTQCAYAYSSDEITSLKITSGVSGISIYSSASHKSDYRIKSGEKIPVVVYSKISSNKTNINLSAIETKAADIRVFVGENSLKLDDIYSQINIAEGEEKSIYIRLYDSKNSTDDNYTIQYDLLVEREFNDDDKLIETESEENDSIDLKEYDDIYLNRLVLFDANNNTIDFTFNQTQSIYDINVDENVSYIKIKAVPEQESYKLIINNKDIDTKGSNKYIRDLSLDRGKNLIKIRIISSDHDRREYFLNVTRGKSISTPTEKTITTTTISDFTTNNKNSQNIQTDGDWEYRKVDGTLATGWTNIRNEWYYFDSTGSMKTGLLKDTSGKWYYLKESGAMARDTTIAGYKIDSDGICIIN
jgi:hypothetical protein